MGKRVFMAVLVCLLAGLGSLALSARAEENPQLWSIWEFVVKPPKAEAFYNAAKAEAALLAKYKLPYNMYAYYVGEFRYMYVTPLKNYGDMESLYQAWEDVAKKAGDEWKNLEKAYEGTTESVSQSTWYERPELNYEPANPRLKPEEQKFILDDIMYVDMDKAEEFRGLIKDFIALCKSKNVTEQIRFYVCDIGPEMPVYVAVGSGKDRVDYWDNSKKMWDMLGEEGKALAAKASMLIRKEMYQERWYLPELSYIVPEEKK